MKRLNKKGFTLAELLIVIAIIAILIAIAIPAFSASLDSAKLQTDHGNIRSAYAMYKTADMLGVLEDVDLATEVTSGSKVYYFQKDGTLDDEPSTAYALQTNGDKDKCASSAGCLLAAGSSAPDTSGVHKETYLIAITATKDGNNYKFTFGLVNPAP